MITIEYYRYIIEPNTIQGYQLAMPLVHTQVLYHIELDHVNNRLDMDCSITRALTAAKAYLNDHYGCVHIYTEDQGAIKLCNKRRFYKDMISNGIFVQLSKGK